MSAYTREKFSECDWKHAVIAEDHYGYSSIMQSFQSLARQKHESGQQEHAQILELLARASSMMIEPKSINEPFKPYFQNFQNQTRSAIPDDFSEENLAFFESILNDIDNPWLIARLADLLWLCKKPKNPGHARIAIDAYISLPICAENWRLDIDSCWERAGRLCIQIKEFERLNEIRDRLFSEFSKDHAGSIFMSLWIADLLDKLKIGSELADRITTDLFASGQKLKEKGDFTSARSYFELATKKYQQIKNEVGRLECLVSIADCFEKEADIRQETSSLVANMLYENAIQAYRRIPVKNRVQHCVEERVRSIRTKITISGQASLDEMHLVTTDRIDITEIVKSSQAHVSGKSNVTEAVLYFSGIYSGPNYCKLESGSKERIKDHFISALFGSSQIGSDGRVVAKTPPMNLHAGEDDPSNQRVLIQQIQQTFSIEIKLVVEGQILPALNQILMEHRVTKDILERLCYCSPIVPKERISLLASALWCGFEFEFGDAIHLLCPQVEHIVRTRLKQAGAQTSNVDKEGIENENGLSTLMDLPEALKVFGEDLTFELKSVFTEALGFNLRNDVAHGLLNDDSASSIATIYAWWMILRLIVHSMLTGAASASPEEASKPDIDDFPDDK